MIDSHTHLHACKPNDAELVAAATQAGVTRMLTVGTNSVTCREALLAAECFPQVWAAVGRHPNEATGFDDADLTDLHALAEHPRCAAIGETGLDYYRDYAPHEDQLRAFLGQIELARATGKPLVIHTRAADDDTIDTLREHAGDVDVILHCFTHGRPADRSASSRAGGSRSRATSRMPPRRTSRRRPSRYPTTACSSRPTRRT